MACLTCAALPRCAIDAPSACACMKGTWLFVGDSVIRGVWSRLGQWLLEAEGFNIHRDGQIASLQRAKVGGLGGGGDGGSGGDGGGLGDGGGSGGPVYPQHVGQHWSSVSNCACV